MTSLQYRQGGVLLVPASCLPVGACRVEPDGQGRWSSTFQRLRIRGVQRA